MPQPGNTPDKVTQALRICGLLLAAAVMLTLDTGRGGVVHLLLLPLALALAAWMILRSLLAVALAGMLMAAVHADLSAADWLTARAYPLISFVCAASVAVILSRRFRRYIRATRRARRQQQAQRRPHPVEQQSPDP